jgi:hypothetical protein
MSHAEALSTRCGQQLPGPDRVAEEWRSVPGYPAYEVSDQGRVRRVTRGRATRPGRVAMGTGSFACTAASEACGVSSSSTGWS